MPSRSTVPAAAERGRGFRVYLRPPAKADAARFLAAVKASRRLHGAWVHPPSTPARYAAFVHRYGAALARDASSATHVGFVVCRCEDDAIVGVFNISEIVRGLFKSAYLGYYALAPHAGEGYMAEGLELVLAGRLPASEAASRRSERAACQHALARARPARRFRPRGIFAALRADRRPLARSRADGAAGRGLARPPQRDSAAG